MSNQKEQISDLAIKLSGINLWEGFSNAILNLNEYESNIMATYLIENYNITPKDE